MTGDDVILLCLFFGMIYLALWLLSKKRLPVDEEEKRKTWNKLAQEKREQISKQLWPQN